MSADGMPGICPFCMQPLAPQALVCGSCARDVIVPAGLVAERDDLLQKCAQARAELEQARGELAALRGPLRRLAMVRG